VEYKAFQDRPYIIPSLLLSMTDAQLDAIPTDSFIISDRLLYLLLSLNSIQLMAAINMHCHHCSTLL
jgi:hypothetical protein